jgi:NAD(P)-dependent dehydrogenase (short-subunit alcohol dehydrogenase family)
MGSENKIALMTGATSGFGKIIAQHLIQKEYSLIFLARSEEKAVALKESLKTVNTKSSIEFIICDLSSLDSVYDACNTVREKQHRIDLLILNAGLWNFEFRETIDGIEETQQVNLIAPVFMLFLLKGLIQREENAKVIFTSSGLHQGTVQFNDFEFRDKFSGFKAYRQSKLGIILMTRLFAQLPDFSRISLYCVHPGMVKTQLGKSAGWLSRMIFRLLGKSVEKGAKTHIHLIDTPISKLISGEYYTNCQVKQTTKEATNLEEAKKLLMVIKDYLTPYLTDEKRQ